MSDGSSLRAISTDLPVTVEGTRTFIPRLTNAASDSSAAIDKIVIRLTVEAFIER